MILGAYNDLTILRFTSIGLYLGDEAGNDILLPHKYKPDRCSVGEVLRVFVYKDSEDRPIATNLIPKIEVNTFASLKVKEVNAFGAFLDWGLEKDLMVPYNEQKAPMKAGYWYLTYLFRDAMSDRLVATSKLDNHFEKDLSALHEKQEVEIIIGESSPLGTTVVVNQKYKGLLYANELRKTLRQGERHKAYIKTLREDGKIDVTLTPMGHKNLDFSADLLLEKLRGNDGFLPIHDNSSPEMIQDITEMSKKSFKKAVGILYKQNLILLGEDGISLV